MKKMKKLVVVVLAVAMMTMCMVACGTVQKDVDGDWTTSTINGQSLEDWAASTGQTVGACTTNWTVKDGKMTAVSALGNATMEVEYKSNGFEAKENGSIAFSVAYNKDAQTLSYKVNVAGTEYDYVMKKGTGTVGDAAPADGGEAAPAEGGEEAPAEGGEEAVEE